jgi:hypothetical protein
VRPWEKLQDSETSKIFQIELTNRFEALKCDNTSKTTRERYKLFEDTVSEAEKIVGKWKHI